jgi:hypothetical protein
MPYEFEPRREIVREHEFEEQLRTLIPNEEEADDYTAAAEDILASDPRQGVEVSPERSIWILPMAPVRGAGVSLFYTFDETSVTFLAILPFDD